MSRDSVLLVLVQDMRRHVVAPYSFDGENRYLSRGLARSRKEHRVTKFAFEG